MDILKIMPDYENSIMNIASSILKYYHVETMHNTIPEIDDALAKNYKNVVFFIVDGMGTDILNYHMPTNSFLRMHKVKDLTSVFPSTTPVATTSMYSGLSPLEHAWVGWNCYFKEIDQELVLFTNTDFYSHKKSKYPDYVNSAIGYETINSKISNSTHNNVATYEVFPLFRPNGVKSLSEMFERINNLCRKDEQKFILAYWDEPDCTMHKVGTKSPEITKIIQEVNEGLLQLNNTIDDTLIIVAADHGQIDMQENIFLDEYSDIQECLAMLPSLGKRVMSFQIKTNKKEEFVERFNRYFKDDFILFNKEDFIAKFLGPGNPHPRIDDFIGDFVAVAVGQKMFQYRALENIDIAEIKANHAGLTHEEMIVPLILVEYKKN